jgi:hypothetical protein
MVVEGKTLHLSGTRNCHLIKIDLTIDDVSAQGSHRFLYFVNTHLHSLMEDDYVRLT